MGLGTLPRYKVIVGEKKYRLDSDEDGWFVLAGKGGDLIPCCPACEIPWTCSGDGYRRFRRGSSLTVAQSDNYTPLHATCDDCEAQFQIEEVK